MICLKVCCEEMQKNIEGGAVQINYAVRTITVRGRTTDSCPYCKKHLEWVEME
jgi:hypothetical protein